MNIIEWIKSFLSKKKNSKEPVDLSKAIWWCKDGESGAKASIVYKIKQVIFSDPIRYVTEGDPTFKTGALCLFVNRNGKWIGGPWDSCAAINPVKNIDYNNPPTFAGRYGPKSEKEDRDLIRPRSGEDVVHCITEAGICTKRSASFITKWP